MTDSIIQQAQNLCDDAPADANQAETGKNESKSSTAIPDIKIAQEEAKPGFVKRFLFPDVYKQRNLYLLHRNNGPLLNICEVLASISLDIVLLFVATINLNLLLLTLDDYSYETIPDSIASNLKQSELDEKVLSELLAYFTATICAICGFSIISNVGYYYELKFRLNRELEDINHDSLLADCMEQRFTRDLLYIEAKALQKKQGGNLVLEYEEETKQAERSQSASCATNRRLRRVPSEKNLSIEIVRKEKQQKSGGGGGNSTMSRAGSKGSSFRNARAAASSYDPDGTQIYLSDRSTGHSTSVAKTKLKSMKSTKKK